MNSVDVIVPCYNYGRFLPKCVESVLAQPVDALRVLIIDDASTDDSLAVAQRLAEGESRIQVISHRQNRGHISTYNEGIDWIEADYMLLLSADDFLAPGALGRAVQLMESHPNIAFTYGGYVDFVEEAGNIVPVRFERGRYVRLTRPAAPRDKSAGEATVLSGTEFIARCCSNVVNPVSTVTAVVRSAVQKQVGGYRHDLPHAGDYEMWLRLAARGDVGEIHAVQGYSRIHDSNMRHQYMTDAAMERDYHQRLAAFEAFFAEAEGLVPGLPALAARARRRLAEEVLADASRKLEEQRADRAGELQALALTIDPTIERSAAWRKLRLKWSLGPRAWGILGPLARQVRRARSFLGPVARQLRPVRSR